MMLSRSNLFLRSCERQIATSLYNNNHHNKYNSTVVRHLVSPAVKRFRKKQQQHYQSQEKDQARNKPTLEIAHAMPICYEEMDNHTLLTVAAMHNHPARMEVLKRNIMSVDKCSYDEASETFQKIAKKNREGMWMVALPYQVGIFAALTAGFASIPMVFDLHTTLWFNEVYVTTEVPGDEDLETGLEVGSWAWNWMEPPLGTMSFVLLCLQYSR